MWIIIIIIIIIIIYLFIIIVLENLQVTNYRDKCLEK